MTRNQLSKSPDIRGLVRGWVSKASRARGKALVGNRVVVLSTADFDYEIWTNKQHLSVGLAKSETVLYIDSMGLRRPTLTRRDASRVMKRLRRWRTSTRVTLRPQRLAVVSPRVLPFHQSRCVRWLNHRLVARLANKIELGSTDVLWTFSPLTYGLERLAGSTVYHSVDLLHLIDGVPLDALLEAEKRLVRVADRVVASSSGVRNHLSTIGATEILLWENVADTELYSQRRGGRRLDRAIFVGHLTESKVDVECLHAVADAGVDLAVAGQIAADGSTPPLALAALLAKPNVTYLGVLSPEELAPEVAHSKVGLIPYLLNPHTAGVFPLKVYEYLAAGLDVVTTPLPSLTSTSEIRLVGRESFASEVVEALSSFTEARAEERAMIAQQHSWEGRIVQARGLIDELR